MQGTDNISSSMAHRTSAVNGPPKHLNPHCWITAHLDCSASENKRGHSLILSIYVFKCLFNEQAKSLHDEPQDTDANTLLAGRTELDELNPIMIKQPSFKPPSRCIAADQLA